jgi:IS30 family transposase
MINSTTTEAIRTTRRKVAAIINKGKQSLRAIGRAIDRPKSTVHNHLKSQASRDQHPESYLWETEAGDAWLRRFVLATLFTFGRQHGIGADAL